MENPSNRWKKVHKILRSQLESIQLRSISQILGWFRSHGLPFIHPEKNIDIIQFLR
jgi:hypothetical protein